MRKKILDYKLSYSWLYLPKVVKQGFGGGAGKNLLGPPLHLGVVAIEKEAFGSPSTKVKKDKVKVCKMKIFLGKLIIIQKFNPVSTIIYSKIESQL